MKKDRRILFTMTPPFNPNDGGVQRTTYKLGKYFTEQGYEVAYFSSAHMGHIKVEYGQLHHGSEPRGVDNPKNIEDLKELLSSSKPDIVINQMPYEAPLREALFQNKEKIGYLLLGCLRNSLFNFKNNARDRMSQMLPRPVFTLLNNSIGERLVQNRHWVKHRRDLKAILDQHDYFVLLAPPNKDELEHFVGKYNSDKVISIPNSIPSVVEKLPKKEKIILHVGRLNVQQKRSDLLLDFWENIYKELPDWKFQIVGDGEYFEELESDLKKRSLPRVQLEGYQKPEPYFEKATFFMMPSAYEGFPNTLLEAQSYGCIPFAFSSYAALDWIVNDEKDAFLIEPYNTREMAKMLNDVTKDESLIKSLQEGALHNARQFTIEQVGKVWEENFKNLIK